MKSAIVIPARLDSTRLSRKLLLADTGKSLIEHTWRSATSSRLADQVIVATDSREIFETVQAFGGNVVMTSADHHSGSDRVAEAARNVDAEIIVNLQGDEPELGGELIDRLIHRLTDDPIEVATLATPVRSLQQLLDPGCVKVVVDRRYRALYFSRSPIPGAKEPSELARYFEADSDPLPATRTPLFLQHLGVYAFRRKNLMELRNLMPSPLEQIESLEQLRFLANGWAIGVEIVEHGGAGIDTPADYAAFVKRVGSV